MESCGLVALGVLPSRAILLNLYSVSLGLWHQQHTLLRQHQDRNTAIILGTDPIHLSHTLCTVRLNLEEKSSLYL